MQWSFCFRRSVAATVAVAASTVGNAIIAITIVCDSGRVHITSKRIPRLAAAFIQDSQIRPGRLVRFV